VAAIDHLILKISDVAASLRFYVDVMGFVPAGSEGPFTVVRVSDDFILQLAPWGPAGEEHLAFALTRSEFDAVVARVRTHDIPHGASHDTVGSQTGPGRETGARGLAATLYLHDPDRHLIEIRTYDP
jgi:catechol 2,3-dioxygenase-like lactoylglutathione lyase family enzyme